MHVAALPVERRSAASFFASDSAVMPYVETTIDIAAPRRRIYDLAKDMERYAEFMPDVEYVRIIRRDGNKTITRWKTLVEDAPIEWTEEDVFDDVGTRIDYRLLDGDLDKFEGSWTFEEHDGVTHVVLGVDYDFGVPTLAELIGPILHKKVEENSLMMLRALKAKSEGPEGGAG
jgi:ribosome-associated toxin RatA of RatAB toxin-antitoxin module